MYMKVSSIYTYKDVPIPSKSVFILRQTPEYGGFHATFVERQNVI